VRFCRGVRSRSGCPFGVVTFLFTDVEGSTRRWEADAEGMRAALTAHDEVLRAAIERHGGWLFKHTGDGVCVAEVSVGVAFHSIPHPIQQPPEARRAAVSVGGAPARLMACSR
jgi:class 3 adenylate cyclase